MAKRTGLGKGLGAIFGEDVVENQENVSRETSGRQTDANSQKEESPGKEYMMKMSLIEPNTEQPRKAFDGESIQELSDSIKKYGVLQPLLVQKRETDTRLSQESAAGVQQKKQDLKKYL